jgi:hypothetical protein
VPLSCIVAPGTGWLSVLLSSFPVTAFWANVAMQVQNMKITTMQPIFRGPFVFFGISSRHLMFSE